MEIKPIETIYKPNGRMPNKSMIGGLTDSFDEYNRSKA